MNSALIEAVMIQIRDELQKTNVQLRLLIDETRKCTAAVNEVTVEIERWADRDWTERH